MTLRIMQNAKVVLAIDSKDKVVPGFLYYQLEKILEIDNRIEDWQDWKVFFSEDAILIRQLKDMSVCE